jgi:Flp pilus assembly protein TadG
MQSVRATRDLPLARLWTRLRALFEPTSQHVRLGSCGWQPVDELGSALIEMAISASIIFSLLLGMIQLSLALYAYHFTADAAREASRWAIVRGNQCSTNTPGLDHCNASGVDIQNYVQGLGYPYAGSMTVSATWLTAGSPPATTWTACGTTTSCKAPGNEVQVTVSYNVPLYIPYWRNATVQVGSVSQMVIAQ